MAASDILYVGTYTKATSKGIYAFTIDLSSGNLTPAAEPAVVDNPSFLAVRDRVLYATSEAGKSGGMVSAYTIGDDGALTLINRKTFGASGPCHVSVTPDGRLVFSANYSAGIIGSFPAGGDGSLGDGTFIKFEGKGPNPKRQTAPHAHSVTVDNTGTIAVAADLGTDRLMLYRIDSAKGTITPLDTPFIPVTPGAGPRHIAFHPNGKYMYLKTEMGGTVITYRIDAPGSFAKLDEISALPASFTGDASGADIHVHASGKYLYTSNRNHDSITIFAIGDDGRLRVLGHEPVRGKHPRNFMLTPDGAFLLVANMQSDTIEGFRIDSATGILTHIGKLADVSMPTCLVMNGSR